MLPGGARTKVECGGALLTLPALLKETEVSAARSAGRWMPTPADAPAPATPEEVRDEGGISPRPPPPERTSQTAVRQGTAAFEPLGVVSCCCRISTLILSTLS